MDKMTVGLPRGMLFNRYETLWRVFFSELGIPVVISEPTTQETVEKGTELALDEACLSLKIFLGHVRFLIGKCSMILVPRVSGYGLRREMCPRFEALYDIVRNTFRESGQSFLTYNVDVPNGNTEEKAFMGMGRAVSCPGKAVKKAYAVARKAEAKQWQDVL